MIGNYTKSRWTGTLLAAVLITAAALTGLTGCSGTTGTAAPDTASPTISSLPADSASETSAPGVTEGFSPDIEPSPSAEPIPAEAPGPDPASSSGVARIFYGDWVIQKVLAYGSTGTYGKEDAEALIGQTLNFSKDAATLINDQPSDKPSAYENPAYTESTVTQSEFIADFNMSFDKLGLSADSAALYTVSVDSAGGCVLLVKDADTLILYAGGTFFELTRAS